MNKLDPSKANPQPGTFPSLFKSEDADALAFIAKRHGSVRLADTIVQFNEPGRAIMRDGLYDDGLVRTHRAADPSTFKIGKDAQSEGVARYGREGRATGLSSAAKSDAAAKLADSAHVQLRRFFDEQISNVPDRYRGLRQVGEGEERGRTAHRIVGRKRAMAAYEASVKSSAILKRNREEQRKAQQVVLNNHLVEAETTKRTLDGGENLPGSRLAMRVTWSLYRQFASLYDRRAGRSAYRKRFDAISKRNETDRHRALAEASAKAAEFAESDRVKIERLVRQSLGDYFEKFGVVSQVGTESEPLREVKPWMDALIEEMETNELRRYERQAREAADKAATLLRGEFINALTSRISKMERELIAMNRGLADHPFHNERYSFHHTRLAEFQPILKIIEIGKTSPEALDMLFKGNQVPEDFPHRDTLDEIEVPCWRIPARTSVSSRIIVTFSRSKFICRT